MQSHCAPHTSHKLLIYFLFIFFFFCIKENKIDYEVLLALSAHRSLVHPIVLQQNRRFIVQMCVSVCAFVLSQPGTPRLSEPKPGFTAPQQTDACLQRNSKPRLTHHSTLLGHRYTVILSQNLWFGGQTDRQIDRWMDGCAVLVC